MRFRSVVILVAASSLACGDSGDSGTKIPAGGFSAIVPQAFTSDSASIEGFRTHIDSLSKMTPAQIEKAQNSNAALVLGVMKAFNEDLSKAGVQADEDWKNLNDWIRSDLIALPILQGSSLTIRTRQHVERLEQLINARERMLEKR
jgi:hypothetical protein